MRSNVWVALLIDLRDPRCPSYLKQNKRELLEGTPNIYKGQDPAKKKVGNSFETATLGEMADHVGRIILLLKDSHPLTS